MPDANQNWEQDRLEALKTMGAVTAEFDPEQEEAKATYREIAADIERQWQSLRPLGEAIVGSLATATDTKDKLLLALHDAILTEEPINGDEVVVTMVFNAEEWIAIEKALCDAISCYADRDQGNPDG